jgi:Uma2 family endonuclease
MHPTGLEHTLVAARPGIERLSVDQFHRMIELGILRDGEPIELIDGILVRKDNSDSGGDPMTHGPRHAYCVQRLKELEARVRQHGSHLRQQLPITLSESREPEPDITVAIGTIDDYRDRHPTAAECLVAIEVAASSLEFDRCVKEPIYAAAGIPVYWIVNIPECRIEVYQSPIPSEGRYRNRVDYKPSDTIKLPLSAGRSIDVAVDEILPASSTR